MLEIKTIKQKLLVLAFVVILVLSAKYQSGDVPTLSFRDLVEAVVPPGGFDSKVKWSELGSKLVDIGAIDPSRFDIAVLGDGTITINPENAHFWVNALWALGLAQSSQKYTRTG